MASTYITTATTTQCETGNVGKVKVQVNTTLVGTITVIDGITGAVANKAVIANPAAGTVYEYWDFQTGVRIVTSAICDVTVNTDSGRSK